MLIFCLMNVLLYWLLCELGYVYFRFGFYWIEFDNQFNIHIAMEKLYIEKKRLFILFLCSNTKIYMKKKVYFIFVFQHKNLHAWKMFILYLCFNTNNNIQKKCLNIKVYKKNVFLFIYWHIHLHRNMNYFYLCLKHK